MRFTSVAAIARNGVIGQDGGMPWRLPSDLKHFQRTTMGKPLIMGRKTWESVGRYLKGRDLIVITRQGMAASAGGACHPGTHIAGSLEDAVTIAKESAAKSSPGLSDAEIIIAGGGEIYRQAMAIVDRLIISHVDLDVAGDTVFPKIDPAIWIETSRLKNCGTERDSADYDIVTYERMPHE